ncbi:MAG TPA: Uma2 family endonuclease [Blastocatellia bacterium]|nr:Uma2 family endonuclease [Blastocatellia bacterium]HMV84415.1 Uma2 family endonuclease [Blastocatellia bacterium]HMX30050.1 Uma2 family endonuclease [Blastocatellia bacterium]HMY71258.1 Uma2 family endonuclease [Blastocatellia bacterium]HMZ22372.1 Uma2 family endonuclease [Blastocatellia bacterium]
MSAIAKRRYTLEEYLELEKSSEERYEYFDGEVFAMAGGSLSHSRIGGNAYSTLQSKLKGGNCEAFNSEMRIKVPQAFPYRYPDASVVCGEPMFEEISGQVMLVNPIVIVEVLSPSTAAYDLKDKFIEYQSIDSFEEYLVISQDTPHVIHYLRQSKRKWLRTDIEGLDAEVTLESINVTLPLHEIYERVKFDLAEASR